VSRYRYNYKIQIQGITTGTQVHELTRQSAGQLTNQLSNPGNPAMSQANCALI